jgi:kynurenine formamidase
MRYKDVVQIFDISVPVRSGMPVYPGDPEVRLERVSDMPVISRLDLGVHTGTHVDAPLHFARGAQAVDQIPIERFFGYAVVIDVVAKADRDPDYQVSIEDIMAAQREGPIATDSILLFRTGFSRRWPDAARYLGTAARGPEAVRDLHFPGLHPDAAKWLIANLSIRAVGIDTASIDYGQSTLYETHRALFERNIPAFENLTALERLPLRGAAIVALPMKIGGGSGAPLRAVAILPRP